MKIVFIDTETTGMNRTENDIIQIAGVVLENGKEIDSFDYKCQPVNWDKINSYALKVNNTTREQLKTYPTPKETFKRLLYFLRKHYDGNNEKLIMGGQNIKGFDWAFVLNFWNKHKDPTDPSFDNFFNDKILYDLMDLTKPLKNKNILKVENIKLGTIIEALDIPIEGNLHDALTDIIGTYKSFYKVVDIWQESLKSDPSLSSLLSTDIKHLFKEMKILL
jgi:DNA polymerase III epsilon subunit-like protein